MQLIVKEITSGTNDSLNVNLEIRGITNAPQVAGASDVLRPLIGQKLGFDNLLQAALAIWNIFNTIQRAVKARK